MLYIDFELNIQIDSMFRTKCLSSPPFQYHEPAQWLKYLLIMYKVLYLNSSRISAKDAAASKNARPQKECQNGVYYIIIHLTICIIEILHEAYITSKYLKPG